MAVTVNGQPVSDPKTTAFMERLRTDDSGNNNGDSDFTTQELEAIFTVNGVKNHPFSDWENRLRPSYLPFARDAYEYIQKNHPEVFSRQSLCLTESCSPTSSGTIRIQRAIQCSHAERYYLFQTGLVDEVQTDLLDSGGNWVGVFDGAFHFFQDNDTVGMSKSAHCAEPSLLTVERFLEPRSLSLPPLQVRSEVRYDSSYWSRCTSGKIADSKVQLPESEFENVSALTLDFIVFGRLRSDLQLLVNGEDILKTRRCSSQSDPDLENFMEANQYFAVPLHLLKSGENTISFQGRDLFGRVVSYTTVVSERWQKVDNFAVWSLLRGSRQPFDEELEKETMRAVRAFNATHHFKVEVVVLLRGFGGKMSRQVGHILGITVPQEESNWRERLRDTLNHEMGGHLGFMNIPMVFVRKLDRLYAQLVNLDRNSNQMLDRFGRTVSLEIRRQSAATLARTPQLPEKERVHFELGIAAGVDLFADPQQSALAPFQDGLYEFHQDAGHPWDNTSELYASTYMILKRGDKRKLLANIRRMLSGPARRLALQVVQVVEAAMK